MPAPAPAPAVRAPSAPSPRKAPPAVTRLDRRMYRSYRQLFTLRRWIWSHITPAGALVLWAMVAAASFTDVSQTLAHQLLAFLTATLGLAILSLFGRRPLLTVERFLPRHASVGTQLRCKLRLRNQTSRWLRSLDYVEGTPDPQPSVEQFAELEEPGESERNWFDRRYRFYRWRWLCQRNTHARPEPVRIPDLRPGGSAELNLDITPLRRGRLTLQDARVTRLDPFGLVGRAVKIQGDPASVIVYPHRFLLPSMALPGVSQRLHSGGVALAGAVGNSEEFVAVREYRPGDPIRKIHWAGWARAHRPVVKEFQEEYYVRHALLLDTFGGGPEADAFEASVSLAASFACTVDEQDTLLDLMFIGERAHVFTAGRGIAHSAQMLELLASVELHPAGRPEDLEDLVFRHVRELSGCVLVLLYWDEPRRQLREKLEGRGIPTLTFIVRREPAPQDLQLPPNTHWIPADQAEDTLARLRL